MRHWVHMSVVINHHSEAGNLRKYLNEEQVLLSPMEWQADERAFE